jgi:predicted nucleotidyltransferase component of viral defense system
MQWGAMNATKSKPWPESPWIRSKLVAQCGLTGYVIAADFTTRGKRRFEPSTLRPHNPEVAALVPIKVQSTAVGESFSMKADNPPNIRFHEDVELFREALSFTAARTAFPAGLIEKDYFCTVLLEYLNSVAGDHVFKGGTCLAKVYSEFYRLSEDMDFTIPMPPEASRAERSRKIASLKESIASLPKKVSCFNAVVPLKGANNSTQYLGAVHYISCLDGQRQTLQIEISLRELLLRPIITGMARTLLLHPVSDLPAIEELPVRCIDATEALAEKFRAALTRREVAIRDFYDIAHAVQALGVQPMDEEFLKLVRLKLNVLGNDPVNVSHERFAQLRRQLDGRLRPVLRKKDFDSFDLDGTFAIVSELAKAVRV